MGHAEHYQRQRTHSWWVVAGTFVVVLAVLAGIWWQPLTDLVRPNWTETAWYLVAAERTRLVVAVEDVLCELEDEPGPVRLEVIENDERVIVEAERQTEGGLPFVPSACAPRYELVTTDVELDRALAGRGLYGCRLGNTGAAAELGVEDDDCRAIPEGLRKSASPQ